MASRPSIVVAKNCFNLTSLLQTLPTRSGPVTFSKCAACAFSSSAPQQSTRKKRNKRRINDPYRAAQSQQRKSANLALQATLQKQRQNALGDPVRSQSTPFIQSLREYSTISSTEGKGKSEATTHVNFFLSKQDLDEQLAQSKWLTEPIPMSELDRVVTEDDPQRELKRRQEWEGQHKTADSAVQSITALAQGSSRDRTRLNIYRCIEEFGRHRTDEILPPKPVSIGRSGTKSLVGSGLNNSESAAAAELASIPSRVGPDTGSSEVQIAILTAKIDTLVNNLGRKDKHNKRNLRLLVHKRQKLLTYLRRKERGGPRWQHLVEKLGINDAMWKGEISL